MWAHTFISYSSESEHYNQPLIVAGRRLGRAELLKRSKQPITFLIEVGRTYIGVCVSVYVYIQDDYDESLRLVSDDL